MAKVVLTVDDSASIRQMVAFTLKSAGYEVVEAVDGEDGLNKARGKNADLVLTDQNMPKMDGLSPDQDPARPAAIPLDADPDADHRVFRRHEGRGQGIGGHGLVGQTVRPTEVAGSGQEGTRMMESGPRGAVSGNPRSGTPLPTLHSPLTHSRD